MLRFCLIKEFMSRICINRIKTAFNDFQGELFKTILISTLLVIVTLIFGMKGSYASGYACGDTGNSIFCKTQISNTTSSTSSTTSSSTSGNTKVANSSPPCTWQFLGTGTYSTSTTPGTIVGSYYKISCAPNSPSPNLEYYNLAYYGPGYFVVWVPPSKPVTYTYSDIENVASQAEDMITLPSPTIILNPSALGVVNLPEIYSIGSSIWHSYVASASTNGISATATAVPISIDWSFGDGSSLSCSEIGSPSNNLSPNSCTHSYTMSSYLAQSILNISSLGYLIKSTVVWKVTWTSSVPGFTGTLGNIYTSSTRYLQVEQIESINQ